MPSPPPRSGFETEAQLPLRGSEHESAMKADCAQRYRRRVRCSARVRMVGFLALAATTLAAVAKTSRFASERALGTSVRHSGRAATPKAPYQSGVGAKRASVAADAGRSSPAALPSAQRSASHATTGALAGAHGARIASAGPNASKAAIAAGLQPSPRESSPVLEAGQRSKSSANHSKPRQIQAASWLLPGEAHKAGAGILLFAYGGHIDTLQRFLLEATTAGQQLRRTNPALQIGIVSNNLTVDRAVFTQHIVPREDLLFQGAPCPYGNSAACKRDLQGPRQWMTRLYYLAHSPYKLTWALDSNVFSCSPDDRVTQFLQAALSTHLWGYDIAHANQGQFNFYPHNWNLMLLWNPRTSNLVRDWLLLQLRRGITTDDQATLRKAEYRAQHLDSISIGQMPTPFAASFYSPFMKINSSFYPRITRPFAGRAHIIHAKLHQGKAWCATFNQQLGARQIILTRDDTKVQNGTSAPMAAKIVTTVEECKITVNLSSCPYAEEAVGSGDLDGEYRLTVPPDQVHAPTAALKLIKVHW